MRPAALSDQIDGRTGANRVVDFSDGVSLAQEFRNRGGRRRRGYFRPIADVRCGQADPGELGACLNFDAFKWNAKALGFTVQIIAVASGQSEHEELAAVDAGSFAARLRGDRQGLRHTARAYDYFVNEMRALDDGGNLHNAPFC